MGLPVVVLLLIVVVANQIGAILIAKDLRDQYQALVDGEPPADGQAPADGQQAGAVTPELTPKAELEPVAEDETNVSVAPAVPPRADRDTQAIVDVAFEVVENVSTIDPGRKTRHETWGYKLVPGPDERPDEIVVGTPGPMIRARVGDVLRFTITNPKKNKNPHNVDFHAVTGQGGGAEGTTVLPGETKTIEARLLYPGIFKYHCAYGDVPAHIAHGMVGGILVDPAEPLPEADHEWYVVQSEYYADARDSRKQDRVAVRDENPSHVVFNGAVGALTEDRALEMKVGERARIYFVNGGLNLISSFHPIGSHWDAVYQEGALLNRPLRGSQTTLVPPGGATAVDMVGQVPQTAVLVDHALSRAFDKGAIGHVVISGDENPEIFEGEAGPPGGMHGGSGTPSEGHGGGSEASTEDGPAETEQPAAEGGEPVSILQGSSDFQEEGDRSEFSEREDPGDYSVNVLEVKVGDTVTWTNEDTTVHTVTAVDGGFDSGFIAGGETFAHTFEEPGEFEYYCTPHPWMRAKVIVTE